MIIVLHEIGRARLRGNERDESVISIPWGNRESPCQSVVAVSVKQTRGQCTILRAAPSYVGCGEPIFSRHRPGLEESQAGGFASGVERR